MSASPSPRPSLVPGALLLCRAEPAAVVPGARLLGEPFLLAGAGPHWSVLVPEGRPWRTLGEPVDRVLAGWAVALSVAAPWPVLALWWDADRAGCTLASGFRRPVDYVWLADGTPAGQDEAMRTLSARLGLDPVLDLQELESLTRPDPESEARARLAGLLAVLARTGLDLPPKLLPGEAADALVAAARELPDARDVDGAVVDDRGRPEPVRADLQAVAGHHLAPWLPWSGDPRARGLALAQILAGVPLAAWGLSRRSGGWLAAGGVLVAHGALGLAYDLTHPRP